MKEKLERKEWQREGKNQREEKRGRG